MTPASPSAARTMSNDRAANPPAYELTSRPLDDLARMAAAVIGGVSIGIIRPTRGDWVVVGASCARVAATVLDDAARTAIAAGEGVERRYEDGLVFIEPLEDADGGCAGALVIRGSAGMQPSPVDARPPSVHGPISWALAAMTAAARTTELESELTRSKQLRRTERLASVAPLLSGICHELNNPLTSIKSFAELMLLDDRLAEDREALEIIQREAGRAARVVTDLRLVARQSQELAGDAAVLDLNDLVRRAVERVRTLAEGAEVEVVLELAGRLPAIFGVRSQLERVAEQLLSNAVEALRGRPEPREIHVRTAPCAAGLALSVQDTGPGIAPENLDDIFDPFWTMRTTGEGRGLGLSLAHSVVADHHGVIRVDGGWGRGACFTVELPTSSEASLPGRDAVVQAPARRALRILVVDDEGPIRYSLARYMERRGHTVRDAAEGGQALELLDQDEEAGFDIILADLRMPGLGGEELYNRLKQRGDGLEQRLIFITGDADSPDAARVLGEAGVPVVLKPFELAEIAQIIEAQAGIDK